MGVWEVKLRRFIMNGAAFACSMRRGILGWRLVNSHVAGGMLASPVKVVEVVFEADGEAEKLVVDRL